MRRFAESWAGAADAGLERGAYREILFRPEGGWHIWQIHGFADVEGIGVRVDLDVMRP